MHVSVECILFATLLRSGGNYHHGMSRNPTAAVNLFLVGKQYLTFCTAEDAVTRNLIGRKIISNVKPSDTRNSLGTVAFVSDVVPSSHKRQTCVCTAAERYVKHRCPLYVLGAPSHFPTEYRHEAAVVSREHRMKRVVQLRDGYQWPLPWECNFLREL